MGGCAGVVAVGAGSGRWGHSFIVSAYRTDPDRTLSDDPNPATMPAFRR